ncbi:MAG: DEAD/DEAH box helicase [Propionibacteriaceae bacterium]|nr:DEAD/DEAH box helicase [Propionibacteriaceae bacterium]
MSNTSDFANTSFQSLGLPHRLVEAVTRLGFADPTPIQAAAIPALLRGEDVVGVAQTGTGKTAAFGLPLLARIVPDDRRPQGLVLVPTRELALQVTAALDSFAVDIPGVATVTIYGGAPYYIQERALKAGAQIVVGTPGRVIDHIERGTLDLGGVVFVVLDEGDEMLRMGFAEDVDRILTEVPSDHQTSLFSATMPPEIRRTVETHLRNPRQIAVTPQASTVDAVEQRFAVVPPKHKLGALARVLATSDAEAALVFVRTKAAAEEVGAALVERGVSASVISGNVPQAERERIVERLRSGQISVLVATDVAARGLDVDRIGLVVNFDIPHEADEYVHRIGRTGRAGRTGVAFTFVAPKERERLRRIEKAIKAGLVETPVPSPAEVTAHRVAGLLAQVPQRLAGGRLQIVRQAVEHYLDAGDGDGSAGHRLSQAVDLASVLAALAVGDHGPTPRDDEMDAELAFARDDGKGKRHGREDQTKGATRYWIGVGHRDHVKPGAIVAVITNEGGLSGQDLGRIEMFANFCIVEIGPKLSRQTINRLAKAKVAGRQLGLRPDTGQPARGGQPPKRGGQPPKSARFRDAAWK